MTASAPLTPPSVRVSYLAVHQIKEISSCVSFDTVRRDFRKCSEKEEYPLLFSPSIVMVVLIIGLWAIAQPPMRERDQE